MSYVSFDNGISAKIWAYIFCIFLLGMPIYLVLYCFFSSSKRNELISLYYSLLKENEIDLLVEYINKYHCDDIREYLKGLSHLPEKSAKDIRLRPRTEKDEAYDSLVKSKRSKFAASVYGNIIQNENFIIKAALKYPELFSKIFSGMETEKAANPYLVKKFIGSLFENKNQSFVSELKTVNQYNSSLDDIHELYGIPILHSILSKTKAAAQNSVWLPVGEKTMKSLKYDLKQKYFVLRQYDSHLELEQWYCKVYIAIVYFNYMVRESIYKNSESHMWLFYYRNFTELLIEILPLKEKDNSSETFAHKFIQQKIDNMIGWITLAQKLKVEYRIIDAISCLGSCINAICEADDRKLSRKFKIRQLNLIISKWFSNLEGQESDLQNLIENRLTSMLKNPTRVKWRD